MKVEEFNEKYLSSRVIFNSDELAPGQVIRVYECDILATQGTFLHSGIIQSVDSLMLKYIYITWGEDEEASAKTAYLSATDIPSEGNEEWAKEDKYFIFEVI